MTALLTSALDSCDFEMDDPDATVDLPVLVVDDAVVDRRLAGNIVAKITGLKVLYATNGKEALDVLAREHIGLVLTDLQMPKMDGLELAEEVRSQYPLVPLILMTATGSEQIAMEALLSGAASYAPKQELERHLRRTLPQVLAAARVDRRRQLFLESVSEMETHFELPNDVDFVALIVTHLQEYLVRMRLSDQNNKIRVGVALEEALVNGIYHGNLEVSSELRKDGARAFQDLVDQRRRQLPYRERRLHVHVKFNPDGATFVIRDEGPGFNVAALPDPTDPENLLKPSGRGLLLIRTFMDEVRFNDLGNEITLIKRKPAPK